MSSATAPAAGVFAVQVARRATAAKSHPETRTSAKNKLATRWPDSRYPRSNSSGLLLAAWLHYHVKDASVATKRTKIQQYSPRLKNFHLDGDITRVEYHAERVELTDKLAALPSETDGSGDEVAEQLATFLADVPSAWQLADRTERNILARQLFAEVVVYNKEGVAVVQRPELVPFFEAAMCQVPDDMTLRRKRRDSVRSPGHHRSGTEPIGAAVVLSRRVSEKSGYASSSSARLKRYMVTISHGLSSIVRANEMPE
jgi:hypothetical protein